MTFAKIPSRRGVAALVVVALAGAALIATYVSLGGGSYKPLELADPCKPRPLPRVQGFERVSQQLLLSALDGAACRLRVTREELALALVSADSRRQFVRSHHIREGTLEAAVRSGLDRAVEDAERSGRLSATRASLVRAAISTLPIGTLIELVRTQRGLIGRLGKLLGALGGP